MRHRLTILYLYPNEMNIYGDVGNVLTLVKRLEWRGIAAGLRYHHPGDTLPADADIIVGGGGQDSGQLKVAEDLQRIGTDLRQRAADGVSMLMICGMYQLFGKRFITNEGHELPGIGIFDAETHGSGRRLIGPLVLDTQFGEVVGYENHSGQTHLASGQKPFGSVRRGYGNTSARTTEGAVSQNVYGTYLHGAVLPKNPAFADELLRVAMERTYGPKAALRPLDDTLANTARKVAAQR